MRSFEVLVAEAESADVTGWGFGWLRGRAIEERPPWGFAKRLADRLASVDSALDIDTGGGEVVSEAPILPRRMFVTEGWPPNAQRARALLGPRGVHVVSSRGGGPVPFPDESFDLVTSPAPGVGGLAGDWPSSRPGGHYFAQHVGPGSASELIEFLVGPSEQKRNRRDPQMESAAANAAGLTIVDVRTARCRMEFFDVGAVVWILRKCVWWVPDFSVDKYHDRLVALDRGMRSGHSFVAHSTRHLIEARR